MVDVAAYDGTGRLAVRAASIGGVPVVTTEGMSVRSTRAEVTAAQGWDEWDADGDGVADYMGVGPREVPGTQSLSDPGSVGIEYVLLGLDGDAVVEIQLPSNDFSDI